MYRVYKGDGEPGPQVMGDLYLHLHAHTDFEGYYDPENGNWVSNECEYHHLLVVRSR